MDLQLNKYFMRENHKLAARFDLIKPCVDTAERLNMMCQI